jgi:putative DNA primase/helicase
MNTAKIRTDSLPAGDTFLVRIEVADAFCEAFSIADAIERFGLPYVRVAGDRWAYTGGTRVEGGVIRDKEFFAYCDADPAFGRHDAFDLVRLHRFGQLDSFDSHPLRPINRRESYRCMVAFAKKQPELEVLSQGRAILELDPLSE